MLSLLRLSTEEDSCNPPKLPVSKPESSSQQHESPKPGRQKRTKSAETSAVLQSVISRNMKKRYIADTPPQDQTGQH
jgi:hypothetical protein